MGFTTYLFPCRKPLRKSRTYIAQRLSISFCSFFSCSSVELYSLAVFMKKDENCFISVFFSSWVQY